MTEGGIPPEVIVERLYAKARQVHSRQLRSLLVLAAETITDLNDRLGDREESWRSRRIS